MLNEFSTRFHSRASKFFVGSLLVAIIATAAMAASASAQVANPQLSAGAANTCAIYPNQKVYCWGSNVHKQLGIGTNNLSYALQPIPVNGLNGIPVGVSTGFDSACSLLTFGTIRCWGNNALGALGAKFNKGDVSHAQTSAALAGPTAAPAQEATGQRHMCYLDNDKIVKCQGSNAFGQLGNGTTVDSLVPVAAAGINGSTPGTTVDQLVTGDNHTCILLVNNNVKCWGANNVKQLGATTATTNSNVPVDVPDLANTVRQLASGADHTCAIRGNSDVICWGSNSFGELGNGAVAPFAGTVLVDNLAGDAKEIAAGTYHSCALMTNGTVRCWGANTYGQLGNGNTNNATRPVTVAGLPRPAVAITAGGYHSCAKLDDGSIRCWGKNDKGQLGNNSKTNSVIPVAIAAPAGPSYTKVKVQKGDGHSNFVGLFVVRPPVPGNIEKRCVGNTVSTVSVTQSGVTHSKGIRAKLRVSGTKCVASLRVNNISNSEAAASVYLRSSFEGNSRLPAAQFTQTFPSL
jgi:alpha-tubulin suppressor-like RCC1 family protein